MFLCACYFIHLSWRVVFFFSRSLPLLFSPMAYFFHSPVVFILYLCRLAHFVRLLFLALCLFNIEFDCVKAPVFFRNQCSQERQKKNWLWQTKKKDKNKRIRIELAAASKIRMASKFVRGNEIYILPSTAAGSSTIIAKRKLLLSISRTNLYNDPCKCKQQPKGTTTSNHLWQIAQKSQCIENEISWTIQ